MAFGEQSDLFVAMLVAFGMDWERKSVLWSVPQHQGGPAMRRPRGQKDRTPAPTTNQDTGLIALGRELDRLCRRCRRLGRNADRDWASWSAAVEETNALARRIGRMQPSNIAELLIRYEALRWQLVEADDVIMDAEARRAFVAFGAILRRMASHRRGA